MQPDPDGETLACVMSVPEGAACTKDINACGNAGACDCGHPLYDYDPATGQCLLRMNRAVRGERASLSDSDCVRSPEGMCTRDLGPCGQPSVCSCPDGFEWSPVAGKCLKSLD